MSAFIVNRAHIDALVRTGLHGPSPDGWRIQGHHVSWVRDDEAEMFAPERYRQLNHTNASEIGQMLEDECISSVSYRYQDSNLDDLPGTIGERDEPYLFSGYRGRALSAVEGLKALGCYEYQSCEHPGWEESQAHRFCESLRDMLIGELPGYSEADWEIRPPVAA